MVKAYIFEQMKKMRNYFIALLLGVLLLTSCKTEQKTTPVTPEKERTVLEKVAYAHGFAYWDEVAEISFTFNVERDTSHFERSWTWKPKTNDVTVISSGDTATFNRNAIDSTSYQPNGAFVNDKYWLLAPFNLIWDKANFSHEHLPEAVAPISQKPMQKLTIVYGSEGGYTPGDAYDFYFEDDFIIKEWVFRRGDQEEPSMATTWENYSNQKGIKIALAHKKKDEAFNLHFTKVAVTLQ